MSALTASSGAPRSAARRDSILDLDPEGLISLGWDPSSQVFTPHPSHRLLGYRLCAVHGCDNVIGGRIGLCMTCLRYWRESGERDFDAFCSDGVPGRGHYGDKLCLVCRTPGHERPATKRGLCRSCAQRCHMRKQTLEAFIAGDDRFGPAKPFPTFGRCRVVVCRRLAAMRNGLCEGHAWAWNRAEKPNLEEFAITGAVSKAEKKRGLVLRGLPPLLIDELLYAIQESLRAGRRTPLEHLRPAVSALRTQGVGSVTEVAPTGLWPGPRHFLEFAIDALDLARSSIESEKSKDVWDLRLWGWNGTLSFVGGRPVHREEYRQASPITQPWLRQAAKSWAAEALATKRPERVRQVVTALGLWSDHLGTLPGDGEDPSALRRADIESFLAWLNRMDKAQNISQLVRAITILAVDRFLRQVRETESGLLALPPEGVTFRSSDHVRLPDGDPDDDVGSSLPQAVMDQLLSSSSLELFEKLFGPEIRAAVELQAGVGRRTEEICSLSWDCLDFDEQRGETGEVRRAPVLVYDMPKVNRVGCRLEIFEREQRIIEAQQKRVRARFPDTPAGELKLFPRRFKNPAGTNPILPGRFASRIRAWTDALAPIELPERDTEGRALYFPKERIVPYAFRHTFAQRHADNGTDVVVLAKLMGHRDINFTQGYYRVTRKRRRQAQDALGPLQIDTEARQTRPNVKHLSDGQALRDEMGSVAVPFGVCTEPSNVRALGQDCVLRYRCFGCTHFRTDPSFQAELKAHHVRLLTTRERLIAADGELAEWARRDALPSDEEIAAAERLIASNDKKLAELDEPDRKRIEEAISLLRRHRVQLNEHFPVEFRNLVTQRMPTVFPNVEREQRELSEVGDIA
jgi:integrase